MRIDGWEARLAEVVDAAIDRPFAWGTHDCCTFAAACVDAVTGSDHLDHLGYEDERTAKRVIACHGGLVEAIAARLGSPCAGWAHARRGDICLVPTEQGDGLGVCVGHRIVLPGERGLASYPLHLAQCTWRVGDA